MILSEGDDWSEIVILCLCGCGKAMDMEEVPFLCFS